MKTELRQPRANRDSSYCEPGHGTGTIVIPFAHSASHETEEADTLGHPGFPHEVVAQVSLAVAVYDVVEADDKPLEVMRQGALAGAGLIGGWAAGSAAVAVGVCAATAPVCVGAIAFVGGLLATYGAEASFGSLYPRPTR